MRRAIKGLVTGARRWVPRRLRSSVRLWLADQWPDAVPPLVGAFTDAAVLVLAPHPDDEAIGPGGAVRRHVLAGASVEVVVLTDGRWGGPNRDGTLVDRRKAESRAAAEILGTKPPAFWDVVDTTLTESPDVVSRLVELLVRLRPAFVYLPSLTDAHPDHWATNRVLYAALAKVPADVRGGLVVRGYELWAPALANVMVDVTAVADVKRQAVGVFASQTVLDDYAEAVMGLNRYRSLRHLHGRGYVEAFHELTAAEYARLFAAASLRHAVPASTRGPSASPAAAGATTHGRAA